MLYLLAPSLSILLLINYYFMEIINNPGCSSKKRVLLKKLIL